LRGRSAGLIAACGLAFLCVEIHAGGGPVATPRQGLGAVLESRRDAIMALPGVVGTGLSRCDDQPCITVLANQPSPELEQKLERLLGGYRFKIVESGPIRAYPESR
jgi:hypothetical protein